MGKGKKRKSKKEKQLPALTYQEGVLTYQISNKEKQLEDIKYEIKLLEDQNIRHKDRNEALNGEQARLVRDLLKSSREKTGGDEEEDEVECVSKEQVAAMVYQKYNLLQLHQKELSMIQSQINGKEREIGRVEQDLQHWTGYKTRGADEQKKQISLLKHEIYDMETQFQRMSEMLERSLRSENVESEVAVNRRLDDQRYLATRNAIARMDKHSRQEVIDNDWLVTERSLHEKEIKDLMGEVEEIERDNLELMNRLQRYQTEDVMLSRSRALNQIEAAESIDESCSEHEIDLSRINFSNKHGLGVLSKSSVLKAVQQRIAVLTSLQLMQESEKGRSKGGAQSDLSVDQQSDCHEKSDFHLPAIPVNPSIVQQSQSDREREDYMRLGPIELKHMGVRGERASLHTPQRLTEEERRVALMRSSDWPVTHSMLVDRLSKGRPINDQPQ